VPLLIIKGICRCCCWCHWWWCCHWQSCYDVVVDNDIVVDVIDDDVVIDKAVMMLSLIMMMMLIMMLSLMSLIMMIMFMTTTMMTIGMTIMMIYIFIVYKSSSVSEGSQVSFYKNTRHIYWFWPDRFVRVNCMVLIYFCWNVAVFNWQGFKIYLSSVLFEFLSVLTLLTLLINCLLDLTDYYLIEKEGWKLEWS